MECRSRIMILFMHLLLQAVPCSHHHGLRLAVFEEDQMRRGRRFEVMAERRGMDERGRRH